MKILIVILILWSIFNTFLSVTSILASKMNNDEIEAIKCWYPFCEIMKIRIPKNKGGDNNNPNDRLIDRHMLIEEMQKATEKETSPTIRAGLIRAQKIALKVPAISVDKYER